jgi:ABC-type Fe3+ transport system permease subunit
MSGLSISKAWDDSKAILSRDGRLFVSIALCLVALPTLIMGLISPKGMADPQAPPWVAIVSLIASLVALAGQMALIRLALAPSTTVADAIGHGVRRMPIYLAVAVLVVVALFLIAIPFVFVLAALGVPVDRASANTIEGSPALSIAFLLFFAVFCFIGVKMIMGAPAATAERIGPIGVIKRSWALTNGHWWRLFGFLALFFIAAMVVLYAVGVAIGAIVGLSLGPIQPMSTSALVMSLVHSLINAALTTLLAVMLARIYVQLAGRSEVEASVPKTGI